MEAHLLRPQHHVVVRRGLMASGNRVQHLLETAGVRFLRLGQGFKPVRNLGKALFASSFCHVRVDVGVRAVLAGDRGLQIVGRLPNGQLGCGIAN